MLYPTDDKTDKGIKTVSSDAGFGLFQTFERVNKVTEKAIEVEYNDHTSTGTKYRWFPKSAVAWLNMGEFAYPQLLVKSWFLSTNNLWNAMS